MSPAVGESPKALGFAMPAEWREHEAIWLSWPHDTDSFPQLQVVEQTYCEIIKTIAPSEEVRLFVTGPEMRDHAAKLLAAAGVPAHGVRFYLAPYADVWFRDYGPIFITHPERGLAMTHWIFNAWGEKYEPLRKDTEIPGYILERHPMPCFKPGLVLEGGSIEVNGAGSLLTTEQCLLNKKRNSALSRGEIERALDDYLGAANVIWLGEGVAGDDTDGHIDDIARFVDERTIVAAVCDDPKDPDYKPLADNWKRLEKAKDAQGRPFTLVKLPMPGKQLRADGSILPASYTNFYIGNGVVMVPVFSQKEDAAAVAAVAKCFPKRRVHPIACTQLVHGNGTLHCISQQQPRTELSRAAVVLAACPHP